MDAKENGQQPAMPTVAGQSPHWQSGGLTKREYFAGLVLQGYIVQDSPGPQVAASWAVAYADALLVELAK